MHKKMESNLKITVIGVGGAGGNIVTSMAKENIDGIDIYITNTDVQDLEARDINNKIPLGPQTTQGFGAGADPEIGKKAFAESKNTIEKVIGNSHIVFTVFGLGGGTGTGAGPKIAKLAKEKGALSIVLATMPFAYEGKKKNEVSKNAINLIEQYCDSYTLFSNEKLSLIAPESDSEDSFSPIDKQIRKSITTINDIIRIPGKINIDFADVKAHLTNAGHTIIATGQAFGPDAAATAVKDATENPLFEASISGCTKAIINTVANPKISHQEQNLVVETLKSNALTNDLDVVAGLTFQEDLTDEVNISIIATGIDTDREMQNELEQQELAKKIDQTHLQTEEMNISIDDEFSDLNIDIENDDFEDLSQEIKDDDKIAKDSKTKEEVQEKLFSDSYDGKIFDDTKALSEEVPDLDDEDIFEFEE